ncbi:MAG: CDP-alcohol phosphatidyltransferase family protein [Candidatus Aminicenantes bacterium]|nr:CDP-alcohol phosphatidyltransferase family protein [Candidatus Aminicenantes bacterium]
MSDPASPPRAGLWTAPNLLSLARILLVPVFLWVLTSGRPQAAFFVFSAAAATDFLDGLAARLLRQKSRLGLFLDPAADKLLMTAAFIACAWPGVCRPNALPPALTVVVVSRDLAIVLGAWILYRAAAVKSFAPSLWGKISTICQMACLFSVLLFNALNVKPAGFLAAAYVLTLATTLLSAGHYFWEGFVKVLARRPTSRGGATSRSGR